VAEWSACSACCAHCILGKNGIIQKQNVKNNKNPENQQAQQPLFSIVLNDNHFPCPYLINSWARNWATQAQDTDDEQYIQEAYKHDIQKEIHTRH